MGSLFMIKVGDLICAHMLLLSLGPNLLPVWDQRGRWTLSWPAARAEANATCRGNTRDMMGASQLNVLLSGTDAEIQTCLTCALTQSYTTSG
mmetsp:Transcript_12579/g.22261  ORF Transcript_12579/g.22261 Transcript_12579/m.22261 type:complete len:92 (+) Transcript_12579:570-845(+)